MDSSFGVIGLEDITAADQDVYAGIDKPGSRFCLHAAIYFDECPAALALNELAEPLHFPNAVLDELLSAEPRINTPAFMPAARIAWSVRCRWTHAS